mgnify:CR=1 FL=1
MQVLHLQQLAHLLTALKGTKIEKNNKIHVQVLHLPELARLQTVRKGTRSEKNNKKTRTSSSFAGTCSPSNSTKRHKKREKQQNTRASSSFAGTCNHSNCTKRHKKGEKQQNTRASSSFAGYSTRFRGKFSLFLARKTLENDFTHWNIVQMKIFQGLYSRISRSERWVFFFWLRFDFFPLQGAFFVHFSPTFRFPKNNHCPFLPCFSPPETPVCYSQNTIPKKSNQQQKGEHQQHMHQKKATHK